MSLLCLSLAGAQQKLNYLNVNGQTWDDAGPYYFTNHGNSRDAFAKAEPLARALGLELHFSDSSKTLIFQQGPLTAELKTTSDVVQGLEKQASVFTVNGQNRDSPMGILAGGVSYVAISPLVAAFGGHSEFSQTDQTLYVYASTVAAAVPAATPSTAAAPSLGPPRVGVQDNGVTRVVIDLPAGSYYELLVSGNTLAVKLPQLSAEAYYQSLSGPNIEVLQYGFVEGVLTMVINTSYSLQADGQGFRFDLLPANDTTAHERLFIDFAPQLSGQAVSSADTIVVEPIPAATVAGTIDTLLPSNGRKVVVIDPGHGGRDPGAVSNHAVEKEVVLSISLKLRDLLESQGIEVIMTRDRDEYLSLERRSSYATTNINLFVSVHANSVSQNAANARGIETWVFGEPLDEALLALAILENGGGQEGLARTEEARNIANDLAGQIFRQEQLRLSLDLADTVQRNMVNATGAKDRGVRENVFYVIRTARAPAILVEVGFVSHSEEGQRLASTDYQRLLAEALADGIVGFMNHGGLVSSQR